MGKTVSVLAVIAILTGAVISPFRQHTAQAQTAAVSCSGAPETAPMQGHYTGTWHSDADYHFDVLQLDVELKVIIDGTIDATVGPTGQVSGAVQGKVSAPLYHNGIHDIGSGYGTISGTLTGIYGSSGAQMILTSPTIFMHWGTFVGDGSTQDRYIRMPDYQFNVGALDCISTLGTIAETNFPQQTIIADESGQLAYAIGVGQATGTWSLTSDSHDRFTQLSSQVDAFISSADALLRDPPTRLTPDLVSARIAVPLKALEDTIRADPSVARCLLDRLGAWEASVVSPMLQSALSKVGAGDLSSLRQGGDLLRSTHLIDVDCNLPETDAANALTHANTRLIDHQLATSDWVDAAQTAREQLLLTGDAGRANLQAEMVADLHGLTTSMAVSPGLLDMARVAFALGDMDDSGAAVKRLALRAASFTTHATIARARPQPRKKPRRHRKPTPTPKPTARPKAKPKPKPRPTATRTPMPTVTLTPAPTATPKPRTLQQILTDGIARMQASSGGGLTPALSWQQVPGASSYVVVVMSGGTPQMLWSWSGNVTSVAYGDTALPSLPGIESWPVALPSGATWSVLALDSGGKVVGATFGASM